MAAHGPGLARAIAISAGLAMALQAGCSDRELTGIEEERPAFAQVASVPGMVVNSLDDVVDATGCDATHCSLREAIAGAASGATITFADALTAGGAATIEATTGTLLVEKNLTITGPGPDKLTVRGGGSYHVFEFGGDVDVDTIGRITVVVSGLTITGGSGRFGGGVVNYENFLTLSDCAITGNTATDRAGGIDNYDASVTLVDCVISGNKAGTDGGGIYTDGGTVSLTRTTVSANEAAGSGGGIYLIKSAAPEQPSVTITESTIRDNTTLGSGGGIDQEDGYLTVAASTLSGNSAWWGGGIEVHVPDATVSNTRVINSTISGNTATYGGGGIDTDWGRVQIVLSTITGNVAGENGGGGVYSENYDTDIKSSLIWGNTSSAGGGADDVAAGYCTSPCFTSLGYNLIGTPGAGVNFAQDFNATGDQTGVTNADWVKLSPLANNGGPTQTHALSSGSLAVDAGNCADHTGAAVGTDQRGTARPQGGGCDVGAYEGIDLTGALIPNFTFDLSGLGPKKYGDASFSVGGYAISTNSGGSKSFGTGTGSVGCSVNATTGVVTLTGAAQGTSYCILTATLAPDGTYRGAGPLSASFQIAKAALTVTANNVTITYGQTPGFSVNYGGFVTPDDETSLGGSPVYTFEGTGYSSTTPPTNAGVYSITPSGLSSDDYAVTYVPGTFTINKAPGSVSITNIPSYAAVGGSFTPTFAKLGDGAASVISTTDAICTVAGTGVVTYESVGTCTLQASVTEGTNHLAATALRSFTVSPAPSFACTHTVNPKNGSFATTVTWADAVPGVTKIILTDGRTITKQMAPSATGSWSTSVKTAPSYQVFGGTSRKDASKEYVPAGTACEPGGL